MADIVKSVKAELKQGIGKKSGKSYIALSIEFPNGFKKTLFPETFEERFVWEQCLNMD